MISQVTYTVQGDNLIITVPLNGPTRPSSTGKTDLLATASEKLPDGLTRFTLSVYRKR